MNTNASNFRPIPAEDLAMLGTAPVPAKPYYDPDYFAAEREAIFRRTWLQIGHVCELGGPGGFIVRSIDIANAAILVTQTKDGTIRAFYNVCTHRGTELVAETDGRASAFSCRYHRWTFGNDGALRAAPEIERFFVDKADCGLKRVAVDVCAGLIFVNLDPAPAETLRAFLGPLAEQLEMLPVAKATTFSEYVYEIDANWKLTYDNFQENYHIRFIHPRSIGEAAMSPVNPFAYANKFGFHGPHRTQSLWTNPDYRPPAVSAQAFGRLMALAASEGFANYDYEQEYYALFPNFFMLGSAIQPFSHCVMPIGPARSRGVIRLYWQGEDTSATQRFAREFALAAVRDIHSEDRAVIESGQRGLSSGALSHINFQTQEALCRHLFNEVDARVQAYRADQAVTEQRA